MMRDHADECIPPQGLASLGTKQKKLAEKCSGKKTFIKRIREQPSSRTALSSSAV